MSGQDLSHRIPNIANLPCQSMTHID